MFKKKKTAPLNLSYFICSNRRAGGTLVCDLLGQTNIAGYPAEYATPYPPTAAYRQEYIGSTSNKDFVAKLIESSTTPNGVFGTKLHSYEVPTLLEKIQAEGLVEVDKAPTVREVFEARFPNLRYVQVLRKNKIRQAVSLYKAESSRVWWEFTAELPMYKQVDVPNENFEYDFSKIQACLAVVEQHDATWEHFFRYNNIEPLVVWYEEFAQDYVGGTQKILSYLGLPTNIEIPPPRTKKQSGAVSEEWERRFKEDLRRVGEY